ncbi:MAG: hypothetical protein R3B68_06100 [Phycisphaerales bacterium]
MVKVIAIVVLLVAAFVGAAYFMQEGPSPYDLPRAVPIDPPAGATVLPDEVRAADVLRPVLTLRGEAAEAAAAEWIGLWSPMRGWQGAVKRIEVRADSTWFSVDMYDSTIIGNQLYLEVVVPGGVPQIKEGTPVIVRGRISNVIPSPDVALVPGRVCIDQATVISPATPE